MMSPVCRKFPGLKFVFSEGGIGWVPNALERADRTWDRYARWEPSPLVADYLRRFQAMRTAEVEEARSRLG